MEYLVPVLILAAVALVVVVLIRWLGRGARAAESAGATGTAGGHKRRPDRQRAAAERVGVGAAREASERLDEPTHQEVYRLIALGRAADAVAAYRRTTGRGPLESFWDVQALAAHPQPWRPEGLEKTDDDGGATRFAAAADPAPEGGGGPVGPEELGEPAESGEPAGPRAPRESTGLTVPQEWTEQEPAADPSFELEVVREDSTVHLSSEDLPPWMRDQLTAMVRDGRLDEAAQQLAEHTALTTDEALQFLQIMVRDHGRGPGEDGGGL